MREYKCPNCGAVLRIQPAQTIVECEYCDTSIDLERSVEELSAENARSTAEKIKEYRSMREKVRDAKQDYTTKQNILTKLQNEQSNKSYYGKYVLFWIFAVLLFIGIMQSILYKSDIFRICLDIAFVIGSGYGLFVLSGNKKEAYTAELKEKINCALLQKEQAEQAYTELHNNFDKGFIPKSARSDEALNYMINALESEKAYTLTQAVRQWEEYSAMKTQQGNYLENNNNNNSSDEEKAHSTKGAEVIGAFAGAAVGTFGSVVAKKVIKSIFRNL